MDLVCSFDPRRKAIAEHLSAMAAEEPNCPPEQFLERLVERIVRSTDAQFRMAVLTLVLAVAMNFSISVKFSWGPLFLPIAWILCHLVFATKRSIITLSLVYSSLGLSPPKGSWSWPSRLLVLLASVCGPVIGFSNEVVRELWPWVQISLAPQIFLCLAFALALTDWRRWKANMSKFSGQVHEAWRCHYAR